MRFLAVLAPVLALLHGPVQARAPLPAVSAAGSPARAASGPQTAARAIAASPLATRAVAPAEVASFDARVREVASDASPGAPVFAAERDAGARAWTVSATIDGAPAHGAGQLCRMRRTRFVQQPQAGAAQRWRIDTVTELAWLGAAAGARCVAPAQPLVLLQPLPDTDVLAAYAHLAPLLQRARLLMAGNSGCAHLRSVNFRLAGMGVSAPPQGAEQMQVLRFDSDRASSAQVWIRRRALELETWHVACAPN